MKRTILSTVFLSMSLTGTAMAQQQAAAPAAPARSITQIAPDIYRVQNDNHYTVYLVTSEGIIMADPINRDFATWLKGELQRRHNAAVRYVLYTHRDWDHASGGSVFADTAQFIAHANMPKALQVPAGNLPLPQNAAELDANKNPALSGVKRPATCKLNLPQPMPITTAH